MTLGSPLIEVLVCIFIEMVCFTAGLTSKPPDYSSASGNTETSTEDAKGRTQHNGSPQVTPVALPSGDFP